MFRRLSLIFACLVLFSALAASFHHHLDGADHPDCAACAVAHQQADCRVGGTAPAALPVPITTNRLLPAWAAAIAAVYAPAQDRAPPA